MVFQLTLNTKNLQALSKIIMCVHVDTFCIESFLKIQENSFSHLLRVGFSFVEFLNFRILNFG